MFGSIYLVLLFRLPNRQKPPTFSLLQIYVGKNEILAFGMEFFILGRCLIYVCTTPPPSPPEITMIMLPFFSMPFLLYADVWFLFASPYPAGQQAKTKLVSLPSQEHHSQTFRRQRCAADI
jgi:hypothetical protein